MKKKIKICCVTGTRADYPRVKSVLREIQKNKNFSLQIIATGSHLLKSHGYSYKEILEGKGYNLDDNFNAISIVENIRSSTIEDKPKRYHPMLKNLWVNYFCKTIRTWYPCLKF